MGLLSEGQPLSWEETKKHSEHVRQHGVQVRHVDKRLTSQCHLSFG